METNDITELIFSTVKRFIDIERQNDVLLAINELSHKLIYCGDDENKPSDNESALMLFLCSKEVEGCSVKSINYYRTTLKSLFANIEKTYFLVNTEDLRCFLANYRDSGRVSKVTVDNVRRIVSSFFSWLESENYIAKSPCRRIHKVKTGKVVKEVYSDEVMELIKQNAKSLRDIAIIDFLCSTGVRVGELVKINISDIDFDNRECVVFGKGNKQRKVYFDAKTKLHLKQYLDSRIDNCEALFVSNNKPFNRLQISGIEIMLRKIGLSIGVKKVHPHKFRRTLATKAIDKGMPIEQVQHLLGHSKIDTTLEYALVDDTNVKISHKKYLE